MNLNTDELMVETFLKTKDLNVSRFEKFEMLKGKTPDFKVVSSNGFFFYCEVKSIDIKTSDDGILFSNIYNSITSKIREGYKQFHSVNSQKLVPSVLALVSHNFQVNFNSFENLMRGNYLIDGQEISNFMKYREGRIKNALREIDLFIFFDHQTPNYFLNNLDPYFTNKLIRLFDININDTIYM